MCCERALSRQTVEVDHVTVYRWVQRFTPLLAEAARPCRHAVGNRWQVDEAYTKVAGRWRYIFRAIDQFGQVIDISVSAQGDGRAARRFFEHAIGTTKARPMEVVTDLAPVYQRSDPSAGNGFGMYPSTRCNSATRAARTSARVRSFRCGSCWGARSSPAR